MDFFSILILIGIAVWFVFAVIYIVRKKDADAAVDVTAVVIILVIRARKKIPAKAAVAVAVVKKNNRNEASGGYQSWSVEECFAFNHAAARTPEAFLNMINYIWQESRNQMNGIFMAFLGTLFTFGMTVLGACNVFFVRREVSEDIQSIFLGFAAGVMVAASVWSLLIPGIERAEQLEQNCCLVAAFGFLSGVAALLLADMWLKKKYEKQESVSFRKNAAMLIFAITVHNIPEGMAVGLGFALAAQQPEQSSALSGAIALAVGIGIQNYPEGTAVALPLIREGTDRKQAFFLGSMSAAVEPVFGVTAAIVCGAVLGIMPFLLAFAAGTMIYVVVQELIPEAYQGENDKSGTLGFIVGFLVMMILDVSLG